MSEELVLGVTYDGESGVQQFVNALEPLPGQVGAIMERLERDGIGGSLNAETGRKLARAVFDGIQSEMAGFSWSTGIKGVNNLLDSVGMSDADLAQLRKQVHEVRAVMSDFAKNGFDGEGAKASEVFNKSTVMGLKSLTTDAQLAERHMESLENKILAVGQRLKDLQSLDRRVYDADSGVSKLWNKDPKDFSDPDFGFSAEARRAARAAGVKLSNNDIVRDSYGLPDTTATALKYNKIIEGALGAFSSELRNLGELKNVLERAPMVSGSLETVKKSLTSDGGAVREQAEANFYRQAANEVAERRAGIARGASVSPSWAAHFSASRVPVFGQERTQEEEVQSRYRELLSANGGANLDAEMYRILNSEEGLRLALAENTRAIERSIQAERAPKVARIEANAEEMRAGVGVTTPGAANPSVVRGASAQRSAYDGDRVVSSLDRSLRETLGPVMKVTSKGDLVEAPSDTSLFTKQLIERLRADGESVQYDRLASRSYPVTGFQEADPAAVEREARYRAYRDASLAREASDERLQWGGKGAYKETDFQRQLMDRISGTVPLDEKFGRTLAEDIQARAKSPAGVFPYGDIPVFGSREALEKELSFERYRDESKARSARDEALSWDNKDFSPTELQRRIMEGVSGGVSGREDQFGRSIAEAIKGRGQAAFEETPWKVLRTSGDLDKELSFERYRAERSAREERDRALSWDNQDYKPSPLQQQIESRFVSPQSSVNEFGERYGQELERRIQQGAFSFAENPLEAVPNKSFRQSFVSGFTGPQDAPFGEMAGQTARIALFYGAAYRGLAMLQQAIADVTAEALDYQGALTEVSVATNRSRGDVSGLADELGSIAASAGYSANDGVRLGAQTVGLWGLAGASAEEQESATKRTAEVSTQLARINPGTELADVATQLVGTARAFNMGVDQLSRIQDSTVYVSRNTGQNSQQLLGATSNVATLGTSAGFSLEELMAIIAQVGTTTGQNPEGTAGQFRQVLSREFEPVARRAEQIFGIDTSDLSTVRDVLQRVSEGPMSQEQLNQFSTIFGKGGSQSVAMITMQNWDRIQGLASGASGAQGIGEETFQLAMQDIGQSLRVMSSEWMELGLMLTQTGILDWIALVVQGATSVAEALQLVVGAFNEIPRPIRSVALAVAEFMAVSKFLRSGMGQAMVASLGPQAGRVNGAVQATPAVLARSFPTFTSWGRSAGVAATNAAGRVVGSERAQALASRASGIGVGPVVGALAGVAVVADQVSRYFEMASRGSEELAEATKLAAQAVTSDDFLAAASTARSGAREARSGTWWGLESGDVASLLPTLLANGDNSARASELTRMAEEYEARAAAVSERQRTRLDTNPSSIFEDFSVDGLKTSMEALEAEGYSAAQRVDMLTDALSRYSGAIDQGGDYALDVTQFDDLAGKASNGVAGLIGRESERLKANLASREAGDGSVLGTAARGLDGLNIVEQWKRKDLRDEMGALDGLDENVINDSIQDALLDRLKSFGDKVALTDADVQSLADSAFEALESSGGDKFAALKESSKQAIRNGVLGQVRSAMEPFSAEKVASDVTGVLDNFMGYGSTVRDNALLSGRSDLEAGQAEVGQLDLMAGYVERVQAAGLVSEEDSRRFAEVKRLIAAKKKELVYLRLAEIDRLAEAALGTTADDNITEQLRIRGNAVSDKINATAGEYGKSVTYNDHGVPQFDAGLGQKLTELNSEKYSVARESAQNELAKLQASMQNVSPGNSIAQAVAEYNSVMAAINSGLYTPGETQMLQLQAQATAAAFSVGSARVQGANANALANIDPRANLARISQQVSNARREMGLYAASDPRYGQLRDQINQLRVQYLEGVASQANALASSKIAGHSSSLEAAQVNVANAKRTLGTQLKGTEGYYNALASLRKAKAELAAEERSQADRVRRLGSDLTDPVEQARLDVKQAQAELDAAKKRGDGPDAINQAQLDLKSAQNSEEAAAFNQRLSDIQTAEELGRVTHSAYMQYLRSEHDRLSAISDRTRQQQDQLDQVDKLMKSAAESLNSQFNLGDVDLPTVYDVRRAIGSGAPTSVADYSNSNNTVVINGSSFEQIVEYLQQFMGATSYTTQGSGRKG